MFVFENDDLKNTVLESIGKYEKHFSEEFPTQEYLTDTDGVVTSEDAERLNDLIDSCVQNDKPVATPEDYDERLY